jgi:CheY-like chemotaxis protein
MRAKLPRDTHAELPDLAQLLDAVWLCAQGYGMPMPTAKELDKHESDGRDEPPSASEPDNSLPQNATDDKSRRAIDTPDKPDPFIEQAPQPIEEDIAQLKADAGDGKEANGRRIAIPAARAITDGRSIARALKPMRKRVPDPQRLLLDEARTVDHYAQTRLRLPIYTPATQRWLSVVLLVDDAPSMRIWSEVVTEFRALLLQLAGFASVRRWFLDASLPHVARLRATSTDRARSWKELSSGDGRTLILIVSDAIAPAWDGGGMATLVDAIGQRAPVALAQVLPSRWWRRTGLDPAGGVKNVHVGAAMGGTHNARLQRQWMRAPRGTPPPVGVPLPVFGLNATAIQRWAELIGKGRRCDTPAIILPPRRQDNASELTIAAAEPAPTPMQLLENFRVLASPRAFELTRLFAASVLQLPIMRLVQRTLAPDTGHEELAEFFLSGLIEDVTTKPNHSAPNRAIFDFKPGIRDTLIDASAQANSLRVLEVLSKHIGDRMGQALSFDAVISDPENYAKNTARAGLQSFAELQAHVLARLGGRYAASAKRITNKLAQFTPGKGFNEVINVVLPIGLTINASVQSNRPLEGKRILWVDDNPDNNLSQQARLVTLGALVTMVTTTEHALEHLREGEFDAIVSDFGRKGEELAGLNLLDLLDEFGPFIPTAIYSRLGRKFEVEAMNFGAIACTNDFEEVITSLQEAIRAGRHRTQRPVWGPESEERLSLARVMSRKELQLIREMPGKNIELDNWLCAFANSSSQFELKLVSQFVERLTAAPYLRFTYGNRVHAESFDGSGVNRKGRKITFSCSSFSENRKRPIRFRLDLEITGALDFTSRQKQWLEKAIQVMASGKTVSQVTPVTAPGKLVLASFTAGQSFSSSASLSFNVAGASCGMDIEVSGPGFFVRPALLNLLLGTTATLELNFTASSVGRFQGKLTCTPVAPAIGGPFLYDLEVDVHYLPLRGRRVLWVDDHHELKENEITKLKSLGAEIVICLTTDEAQTRLKLGDIDAMITDLGRRGEKLAGINLLRLTHATSPDLLTVLYSDHALKSEEIAISYGARLCTEDFAKIVTTFVTSLEQDFETTSPIVIRAKHRQPINNVLSNGLARNRIYLIEEPSQSAAHANSHRIEFVYQSRDFQGFLLDREASLVWTNSMNDPEYKNDMARNYIPTFAITHASFDADLAEFARELRDMVEAKTYLTDPQDTHKNKFGRYPTRNRRTLSATVNPLPFLDGEYLVTLQVKGADHWPLTGEVIFHLDQSFAPQEKFPPTVTEMASDNSASIQLTAWGAFTVGVLCDESLTNLELDLASSRDAPSEFLAAEVAPAVRQLRMLDLMVAIDRKNLRFLLRAKPDVMATLEKCDRALLNMIERAAMVLIEQEFQCKASREDYDSLVITLHPKNFEWTESLIHVKKLTQFVAPAELERVPTTDMTDSYVFISHAALDRAIAHEIERGLAAHGIQTFKFAGEIQSGGQIMERINSALARSTHFLSLLTPISIGREFVRQELNAATHFHVQGKLKMILLGANGFSAKQHLHKDFPFLATFPVLEFKSAEVTVPLLVAEILREPIEAKSAQAHSVPIETKRHGLSKAAYAIVEHFCLDSEDGMQSRTMATEFSELRRLTASNEAEIEAAIVELSGDIRDLHGSARRAVSACPTLFARFDHLFHDWSAEVDALSIAAYLVGESDTYHRVEQLSIKLSVPSRRVNPAVQWLLMYDLCLSADAPPAVNYLSKRLRANEATREFVRKRNESASSTHDASH